MTDRLDISHPHRFVFNDPRFGECVRDAARKASANGWYDKTLVENMLKSLRSGVHIREASTYWNASREKVLDAVLIVCHQWIAAVQISSQANLQEQLEDTYKDILGKLLNEH